MFHGFLPQRMYIVGSRWENRGGEDCLWWLLCSKDDLTRAHPLEQREEV
jgi:hypothetical protein